MALELFAPIINIIRAFHFDLITFPNVTVSNRVDISNGRRSSTPTKINATKFFSRKIGLNHLRDGSHMDRTEWERQREKENEKRRDETQMNINVLFVRFVYYLRLGVEEDVVCALATNRTRI